ncbi:MAG: coenzyme F420-0:L-glutamate ligase [Candidatus Lindowbacteria bacterium RIFCSPLOWO2_12_FULL_62_27]|nr:MAG: coenzyme F420-0:L-glutamate ligase [Candidatus Lindowbacteria bacterium RIFCSPLOWO2_02_FULL_62_12]OGH62562.1 MAG: coenzyme F420-0:L-glutamate ligase [Candidatus Lindowbacteria bacterium RIFCSPLOWO2_12_FULL_62_27]
MESSTDLKTRDIRIHGLEGLPLVQPGDDLAGMLVRAIQNTGLAAGTGDVLLVTQKIVSKAEGRLVRLSEVTPSERAVELAQRVGKDPRKVEVILRESRRVLKAERPASTGIGVLICETRHGLVCANAGVDESNLSDPDTVLCLPADPDASAERIRSAVRAALGVDLAVIITDSFGRPWRMGLVNVAIGIAGGPALVDLRGSADYSGHPLSVTRIAVADELAAIAGLVMGKLELIPAALVRGWRFDGAPGRAADLIRPAAEDLFR